MSILGIDFGVRRIGIARSEGVLAQPLLVLRVTGRAEALHKMTDLVMREQPERVILGFPEGPIRALVERVAGQLRTRTGVPVTLWDETLSSHMAQVALRATGKGKKARRLSHDAAAAAVILQSYLDAR